MLCFSSMHIYAQTFNTSTSMPFSLAGANGSCATPGSGTPNVVSIPVSGVGTLSSSYALTQVRVTLTDCGGGTKNMNLVAFRVMAPNGSTCSVVYAGGLSASASGTHTLNLVSSETCLNNPQTSNDNSAGASAGVSGNYGFFNAYTGAAGVDLTATFNALNADGTWRIIFSESTSSEPCVAAASLVFGTPAVSDQTANGDACTDAIVWSGNPICASTNAKNASTQMPGSSGGTTFGTIGGATCAWNGNNNNDVWIKFTPINTNVCISISGLDGNLQSIVVEDSNADGDNNPCTGVAPTGGANDTRWTVVSCPRNAIYTTTNGSPLNQQHCFSATIGKTYYMVVDGSGGAESPFYISGVSGFAATDCNLSALAVSNPSVCNDNGTPANAADDYYTADVTVTFANKPTTGTLNLSGSGIHSGTNSVVVASTTTATTHVFTGVKIKANGAATTITAAFSATATCTFTKSDVTAVASCSSGGGCASSPTLSLSATSGSTCSSSPITVSGNTFGGSATSVTVTENGTGSITAGASSSSSPFSFTYTPGTGESGTVTITVTTDNPSGSPCIAATATYTLTVNADPGAASNTTSTSAICESSTKSLVGSPAGGTWSVVSGGGSISGTTYTPADVASATSVTIRYTIAASGACAATTSDVTFTVNADPGAASNTTSTSAICESSTKSLVGSPAGGTWSVVSGGGSISGTTYTPADVASATSVTIRYTIAASGACAATTSDVTFTVDANPGAASNTTSTSAICESSTKSLVGSPAGGTWSVVSGGGSISGTTYTPADVASATAVTIRYTIAASGACAATTSDVTFTVDADPTAPTASVTTQPTCAAPTGTITVTAPANGAGVSYTITGTSPVTAPISNTTGVFTGLAANIYAVTTTTNGCTSSAINLSVNAPTGCSVLVNIADPCNCANKIVVGGVTYARETITITSSGSGETWTLNGGSGLFSAAGAPLATNGSVVLAGNGTTYTLIAYVPANGAATYTANFTNGTQNTSVSGGPCAACCSANNGSWQ
ncbi:MAG: hypothetical protein IPN94_00580 [Sphingobacteriales bacterium]|nr:hypothetical protein [Sphingobacteriales bacterium]